MKHHGQGNLRREELIWTSGSKRVRVHHAWELRQPAAGRHGGRSRKLRGHIFKYKHKVGRVNWILHMAFTLKACLSPVTYFLSKHAPCKPPQTATAWGLSIQPPKDQGRGNISHSNQDTQSTSKEGCTVTLSLVKTKNQSSLITGLPAGRALTKGAKQLLYD